MVVLPKNSNFSRGVGGGKKSWTIQHLTQQWAVHAAIVATDPNDLERHYAAGLALQMAGQVRNLLKLWFAASDLGSLFAPSILAKCASDLF